MFLNETRSSLNCTSVARWRLNARLCTKPASIHRSAIKGRFAKNASRRDTGGYRFKCKQICFQWSTYLLAQVHRLINETLKVHVQDVIFAIGNYVVRQTTYVAKWQRVRRHQTVAKWAIMGHWELTCDTEAEWDPNKKEMRCKRKEMRGNWGEHRAGCEARTRMEIRQECKVVREWQCAGNLS